MPVLELRSVGGAVLANWLAVPRELGRLGQNSDRPGYPPSRAGCVGAVLADKMRRVVLTNAGLLALLERATVDPAPCRWCGGTGLIDVSAGWGKVPCDCPSGAARRKGKA